MLQNTFLHLDGFGAIKERQLWNSGVRTIGDYANAQNDQLSFDFSDKTHSSAVQMTLDALLEKNTRFFSERLPSTEFYRIAATYPDETVFIDLETTGLSHYYDEITVIGVLRGDDFNYFVKGDSDKKLKKVLNIIANAKCIVTFNGALFDLKFLRKEHPNLHIPKAHIDLRFFARRFGYSGGQKKTEFDLNIKRSSEVVGVAGEQAPLLWHEYKLGDNKSGSLLVEYNRADVLGMQHILNHLISKKINALKGFPYSHEYKSIFYKEGSTIEERLSSGSFKRPKVLTYTGKSGPTITYSEMYKKAGLGDIKIVGVDLTGSSKRASGCALLDGNKASSCLLSTDEEILDYCSGLEADLVSIDSPLSLPKGRTSAFDDDPERDKYGIMRIAERVLKKRGVNVYPSLLPSMQRLTLRGIKLAKELRARGIAVIESYPGAAQDIMGIPRKQKGLEHLGKGLMDFGIEYVHVTTGQSKEWSLANHDELDAITSAVVGLFFWTGKFEGIGIDDENLMIIPDLKNDNSSWLNRKAIGFSGQIHAGKTTASQILEKHGYAYTRYSQILTNMLEEQGRPTDRDELQKFGERIHRKPGQSWLTRKVSESISNDRFAVIDGLRFPEDHAGLVEAFGPGFRHIFIDSSEFRRFRRFVIDKGPDDEDAEQTFFHVDNHPVEKSAKSMKEHAHSRLENNSDEEAFQAKVKELEYIRIN